jgi:cell division protein FtsB
VLQAMKSYRVTLGLALLIAYLGVQSLTGERGLLAAGERDATLAAREQQLAQLNDRKADLEGRVRYLRTSSLSKDLLEERARTVIGFSDPRDYLIPVSVSPMTPVSTRS